MSLLVLELIPWSSALWNNCDSSSTCTINQEDFNFYQIVFAQILEIVLLHNRYLSISKIGPGRCHILTQHEELRHIFVRCTLPS
jgi:hypothetical protein